MVSNLVNNLARAARRANPNAVVEAWPYSAVSLWSADKYQSGLIESQAHPIRWLYHSVRTQSNFSRSCVIRDELIPLSQEKSLTAEKKARAAELYAQWRTVLLDELENTRAAAPIARADVRLDFYYRGDHMFNHLWDMVDAKAELLEKEIEEFLPSVAERCGVDTSEDRST